MRRVSHVRFFHSDWRSSLYSLSLELEGLLIRICTYQWESGRRLPLDETEAAHVLGLNPKNFRRVFAGLKAAGKITAHADGYGSDRAEVELKAAVVASTKLAPCEPSKTENRGNIGDQSPINRGSIDDQSGIFAENGEQNQSPSKEPITSNQKRDRKPRSVEDGSFGQMWEAYPRKVGKVDARKAWQKLSAEDREHAIAALPAFSAKIRADRTEEKYIPHAASWLNGRRFEDFSVDTSPDIADDEEHLRRLAHYYLRSDDWDFALGPKPGLPGSVVTKELLAEVRASAIGSGSCSNGQMTMGGDHAAA